MKDFIQRAKVLNVYINQIILSNLTLGVGLQYNNVPLIDRHILRKYLEDGFLNKFAYFDKNSKVHYGGKIHFYKNPEEALKNIQNYFEKPPQIYQYSNFINYNFKPLPKIDENDKNMGVVSFSIKRTGGQD